MNFLRTSLACVLLCSLIPNTLTAQKWVDMMSEPDANYYDIKAQFYKDWGNKPYVKGKGWKQFHRWEAFWEPRVLEDGTFPMHDRVWNDFKQLLLTNQQKSGGIGNWSPLGPYTYNNTDSWSPGHGRVNCIAVDPNNSNTIYIGAPVGGIWKTIDGGSTWNPLGDEWSVIGVSGIAVDPNNSNIIYVATGDTDGNDSYSIGVLKSTDGGVTWNDAGGVNANETTEIIIDPNNSNILYLASSSGLLKSTNAGSSWSNVLSGNIRDIDIKPGTNTTLYAVNSSDFYKSTDAGSTWNQITSGLPNSSGRLCIATTAANANYVYVLSADGSSAFQGVYRSTNSANSFTAMNTTTDIFESSQAWYDMALAASQTNADEIVTGVLNVWRSTNGGSSFSKLNNWSSPGDPAYTHADIHFLKYFGNSLFCGSDGGIYESTNSGNSFTDLTHGLQIGQFYRIAGSQNDVSAVSGGLQDNGGFVYDGNQWKVWYGADGMEAGIDPNNSNRIFGMIQYGSLYGSTNGGNSNNGLGSPQSGRWVTPMAIDQNNPRLLAGYDDLHEYDWSGGGWNQLSTYNFGDQLRCIEIYEGNSNIIFVSTNDDIWVTTNNGGSFTNISSNLPTNSYITSIEVNPTNADELWITRGGWSAGNHVYHTSNGGTSWTNITSDLPNLPCNIVKHDNGTNGEIYVGTDIGVYYYDNITGNWLQYMNNLPNVIVNDLEINETSSMIRAGTYGRGVWQSASNTVNSYDAGISIISVPNGVYCNTSSIDPVVRLYNYGSDTLTSCDIIYDINGSNSQTFAWTGSLAQGNFIDVSLPSISVVGGSHTFNAASSNPNGQTDQLPGNDANSQTFTIISAGNSLTLTLDTDCWGSETTWDIVDSTGAIVNSGGPYSDVTGGETILETLCLANGCYDFNIYDAYGDGVFGSQWGSCTVDGDYSIDDNQGNNYVSMITADFGNSATHNFCVQSSQIQADFTSSSTTVCSGTTVDFTDASTNGTPTSWAWSFPGGTPSASTLQNPSGIQYSTPGVYMVELTVSDGVGNDIKTELNYITVNENPSANANVTDATCGQADGSITLVVSGGSSPYTYSWSPGSGNGATLSNISAGNYTATITDDNGCTEQLVVGVNDLGGPTASISSDQTICEGASATITVSGAGTNGSYSWDQGLGNGSTHTVSPSSTTNYSVTLTDEFGCTTTANTTVNVTPLPVISFSPSNPEICEGESINLVASGADTYLWNDGSTSSTITVSPLSTTTYNVDGTSNGCTSNESISVTVNTPPTVQVSPATGDICDGESILLTASGAQNYSWNTGETGNTILVSPSTNTSYSVIGTANGCSDTTDVSINVQALPIAIAGADNLNTVTNATINFSSAGSTGTNFDWDFGDGNSASGAAVAHQYINSGTYTVVLTVTDNGCTNTDTLTITIGVDNLTENAIDGFSFSIYPNPNQGTFSIEMSKSLGASVLEVFNTLGQLVYEQSLNTRVEQIDLQFLSSGIYTLRISQEGHSINQQFVIED